MAQVNIRMDDSLKNRADALFEELGLNMTTAITMFIRQAVRQGAIPFAVSVEPEAEYREWIKQELQKSWERRSDPDAKWYTTEEIRAKYGI